ncbi:MAG: response regulator [Lentisphaeraceae bacterium]|nr:response regulator [Lentisphaeraceae bacterium]
MSSKEQHCILVVDDDTIMREIVGDILSDEGYSVEKFSDTKGVEDFLKSNKVSLVFLDVSMPSEDGYTFLKRLKSEDSHKDLPVIFMTGKGEIDDKVYGFELGAVDYIVKPFHRMDVLMRAKAHIKIVETHNENRDKLSQIEKAHQSLMVLPESLPEAKFGIYFKSMLEAGGDFYEVIKQDDQHYAYFIADISGHDIATSYVMPAVKALMKQCFKDSSNLNDELKSFNKSVKESIPEDKFISSLMLLVDRENSKVTFINMGHLPPVFKPVNKKAYIIDLEGDILGVYDEPVFGILQQSINKDDKVVFFTDGLLENDKKIWTQDIKLLPAAVDKILETDLNLFSENLASTMNALDNNLDDILVMTIQF